MKFVYNRVDKTELLEVSILELREYGLNIFKDVSLVLDGNWLKWQDCSKALQARWVKRNLEMSSYSKTEEDKEFWELAKTIHDNSKL